MGVVLYAHPILAGMKTTICAHRTMYTKKKSSGNIIIIKVEIMMSFQGWEQWHNTGCATQNTKQCCHPQYVSENYKAEN